MGSKRLFAIKEIDKRVRRAADLNTPLAIGGGTILATPQHALDGPEHTEATETDQKLATTEHSGLLLPLSGDAGDALLGDGTWGVPDSGGGGGDTDLDALAHGIVLFAMHKSGGGGAYLLWSRDGITFDDPLQPFNYGFSTRDPSLLHWDNSFWIATTGPSDLEKFSIARSDRLLSGWPSSPTVQPSCSAINPGPYRVWAPEWFVDPEASGISAVHIIFAASLTDFDDFSLYEIHPTNRGMTTWSAPAIITGSGFHSNMIDPFLIYVPSIGTAGKPYKLFYKQERSEGPGIALAESASLTSGYTVIESDDWAGWVGARATIEGFSVIEIEDGRWRAYFTENDGFDTVAHWYSDSLDGWATWSTPVETVWPWTPGHGTPIRIKSVIDHERDVLAHAPLLDGLASDADLAAHLSDVTDAHDASAVSIVDAGGHYTATEVEGALQEIPALIAATGGGLIPVDVGSVAYDTSTPGELGITVDSDWGFDGAVPYYDDTGAAAGEEASLWWDPTIGQFTVIPYDFP